MKKVFLFATVAMALAIFNSCSSDASKNENEIGKTTVDWEMSKLTSEAELDLYSTRGDDNIVDWQLSKEFAELWLQDSIDEGEYTEDSELWNIPVAVYDTSGNIKYYEFRVVSKNQVMGIIVGAAEKSYGSPIVYESFCDGYADEITELYNSGKLSENELPRIVDDGYPNVVFGVINETKGSSIDFEEYLTTDGETILADDITSVLSYDEITEEYPEYISEEFDDEKMQALIQSYEEDGEAFWKAAVENKGHIADFATRGKSKSERTELDKNRIKNTLVKNKKDLYQIYNYEACGPVSAGFFLDYLQCNNIQSLPNWSLLSRAEKKSALYSSMKTGDSLLSDVVSLCGQDGGSVTLPKNIGNAISKYSNYKVSLSPYSYPKKSINNNLPGISLRVFGKGGCHYRPVIGYKLKGWWIFSWPSIKILDLVDCSDKTNGSWETYRPVYHFCDWNIVKK